MSGFSKVGLFLVAPLGNYFRWRFFVAIFFACIIGKAIILRNSTPNRRWRPYRAEYTGSLPNSEVNRRRARSVLNWGTVREHPWVPLAFSVLMSRIFFATGKKSHSRYTMIASGHTAPNTPDLFRTPKLTVAGPGQY